MLICNQFKDKNLEPQMGKHLFEAIKLPCEAIYQKFHLKTHVVGILLFLSTHWIGSRASRWTFLGLIWYRSGLECVLGTRDQVVGRKIGKC